MISSRICACARNIVCGVHKPVNSMSFIWNDNMREKREANANATWRALIRDRPRGDGV
jgi:hypothetical protein